MKVQMKNPLYDDLPSPDEKKEAKDCKLISGLEVLLKKYEIVLEQEDHKTKNHIQSIDQILKPEEINAFLQTTKVFEGNKNYQKRTGIFISKLIKNSYDAENNNFKLNTKNLKEIHYLGCKLEGKEEKPIQITIEGNAGNLCGVNSENSTFNIEGNTRNNCGHGSKNSTYNIKGNAGDRCGFGSNNSTYNIKGNIGKHCGYGSNNSTFNIEGSTRDNCGTHSENSTYNIEGNTGKYYGYGSENSTFITYKQETYQKLLKQLPETNKLILKDKNNKIIEEKTI